MTEPLRQLIEDLVLKTLTAAVTVQPYLGFGHPDMKARLDPKDLGRVARVLELVRVEWCPPSLLDSAAAACAFARDTAKGQAKDVPLEGVAFLDWILKTVEASKGPGAEEIVVSEAMWLVMEERNGKLEPAVDANAGIYLFSNPVRFQAVLGTKRSKRFAGAKLQVVEGAENLLEMLTRFRDGGIKLVSTTARLFDDKGRLLEGGAEFLGAAIEDLLRALESVPRS